jgi:hypothetical protein
MADAPRPAAAPRDGAGWQVGDIVVKTTTRLTTTGGTVWGAAHRAIGFLEACRGQLGLERPGIRVGGGARMRPRDASEAAGNGRLTPILDPRRWPWCAAASTMHVTACQQQQWTTADVQAFA